MLKLHPIIQRWPKRRCMLRLQEVLKSSAPETKPIANEDVNNKINADEIKPINFKTLLSEGQKSSNLVESVFAKLGPLNATNIDPIEDGDKVDEKLAKATNVNALLQIASSNQLTPKHILKIISILGEWTANKKIELADFEKDSRFLTMCTKLSTKNFSNMNSVKDLSTVLGVASDDEAAKLISTITLPQMIKVLSKLAQNKRRSTPILRSLSFNITKKDEKLNIKQAADVLYSMSILNFPDEVLLARVCSDAVEEINNSRSSITGSISTSLGMLRYRDITLLDCLSEWIVKNLDQCRIQDVLSYIMTLALVNYLPNNQQQLFQIITKLLKPAELPLPYSYLDLVWSYVLLGRATTEQIATVLSSNFINKLTFSGKDIPIATKLKLLNINGAALVLGDKYKGPVLDQTWSESVPLARNKEKQVLVNSVMETFSNLLPSATYLQRDVNTGFGFLLDGECRIDGKCNPMPVNSENGIKVGIFILDYQDTCKGARYEPNGIITFMQKLMHDRGYHVLSVPYTEFNDKAKLLHRVQYLEKKLKSLSTT